MEMPVINTTAPTKTGYTFDGWSFTNKDITYYNALSKKEAVNVKIFESESEEDSEELYKDDKRKGKPSYFSK